MAFYLSATEIRQIFMKLRCPQCQKYLSGCFGKQAFCGDCSFIWDLSHMTQWDILDQWFRDDILERLNLKNYPLNAMHQPLCELPMSRIPKDARATIQAYMESDDYEE
jgi:hypothetical protein